MSCTRTENPLRFISVGDGPVGRRRNKERMYYWNKDSFVGLLELAHELEARAELAALAEYCVLREKGLRAQSLSRLKDFLNESVLWNTNLARRNVLIILQANARNRSAHQFMTYPLLKQLIYPTLERWIAEEPTAVEPLRWLGLLRSDTGALRRALSLAPNDIPVRRSLVNFELDVADHSTHHLSESILLLSVEETRESIANAKQWIDTAPDIRPFDDLIAEIDEYEQMLDDWFAYNKSPVGTFPEWCKAIGHTYSWPTVVYYDDGAAQQKNGADHKSRADLS